MLREIQEQQHGIPVGCNRARAQGTLGYQIFSKELLNQRCKRYGPGCCYFSHGTPPAFA
jgi:hypothetical protein